MGFLLIVMNKTWCVAGTMDAIDTLLGCHEIIVFLVVCNYFA
jgi:hypothetical protein